MFDDEAGCCWWWTGDGVGVDGCCLIAGELLFVPSEWPRLVDAYETDVGSFMSFRRWPCCCCCGWWWWWWLSENMPFMMEDGLPLGASHRTDWNGLEPRNGCWFHDWSRLFVKSGCETAPVKSVNGNFPVRLNWFWFCRFVVVVAVVAVLFDT